MISEKVSIVICTHNRSEILCECIETLIQQSIPHSEYELIVVDNASSDNTKIKVKQQFQDIHYIFEAKIGLSYARNAGYKAAQFNWVSYIDDDALVHHDYVEQLIWTIKKFNWDCIGGVFNRWFKYGQPKWYPVHFGTNKFDFDRTGILPTNKYACGGVMTIRKSVLEKLGGFNTAFGMTGNTIGYGEETELQTRMRQHGYTIGFNPDIQIDHLVAKYKLSVWWHLRAAWQNEKAVTIINRKKEDFPFWKNLKQVLKASVKRLKYFKRLAQKDYYWQNFIFDYAEPILRKISVIFTIYLKKEV